MTGTLSLAFLGRVTNSWPNMSFPIVQHSVSPEIGVHGIPVDNFSRSGGGGVNLCRFSAGLDLSEPASSNWSSKTSIKFEVSIAFQCHLECISINGFKSILCENMSQFNKEGLQSICSMFVPSMMMAAQLTEIFMGFL